MNCIIVEDQPPAQRILKRYIGDIASLALVGTFSNPLEAMDFLKKEEVDLMFLDIHLPKISGMEFLKSLSNPPKVILTTAFPEFALESYELSVVDYLLKPFYFVRFVMAVNKALDAVNSKSVLPAKEKEKDEIFIKVGYELIKCEKRSINYIKADGDYTEVYVGAKRHVTTETLKEWSKKLGSEQFIRVHKSYLINRSSIKKISSNQVELGEGIKVPIGRAYKEAFEAMILGK